MKNYDSINQYVLSKGYKSSNGIQKIVMETPEELRDFVAAFIDNDHRATFKSEYSVIKNATLHHHIMGYIVGDQCMTPKIMETFTSNQFPYTVEVVSEDTYTIDKDIVISPHSAPFFINTKSLIIDGGSITVSSTALTINADSLMITDKSASKKSYHVMIQGIKGSDGVAGKSGRKYSPAHSGSNASAPTPGICTGASDGGKGSNGVTGTGGGSGANGGKGLANLPCSITIKSVSAGSNIFYIFTTSGAGGSGGDGGKGGTGQEGGKGGEGCRSGCEGTDGGNGGHGGDGGLGGNGGDGAAAASGNPIAISFPGGKDRDHINVSKSTAPAGKGGAAGQGGKAGKGAKGGAGGHSKSDGTKGGSGSYGKDGKPGKDSSTSGAPGNVTIKWLV